MRSIIERLLQDEYDRFSVNHPRSARAHQAALARLPLGVGSSIQAFDPFPVTITRADGPFVWDTDSHRYLDLNMGFGALLVGHRHPRVMRALEEQLELGTLFVAPSLQAEKAASMLAERFGHPLWRFTSSGTESVMTAVRLARAYTRRRLLVKVEGGYHGHADPVLVSGKPSPATWGPASRPNAVADSAGVPDSVLHDTVVVPFNDPDALERAFLRHEGEVAAFLVEPVMENAGIILPSDGYLAKVRALCDRFGVLLIFDEVKTGLTASWSGASGLYGVTPDIVCLAKSIGGGVPVGAFGGREDVMRSIGVSVAHHGTYNANPLVLAAVIATLESTTPEALAITHRINEEFASSVRTLLDTVQDLVPTTVSTIGSKGSVTFSATPPVTYRDWKNSDLLAAELFWLFSTNRGVLTPPGLDEQWLISTAHTFGALDVYLNQLEELVGVLRRS